MRTVETHKRYGHSNNKISQQNYRLRSLETYLLDQDHRNVLAVARKNLDLNLAADQSVQEGEVIKHIKNIEPGQRLSESQFNSKSGKTKSRDTTQVTEKFFHKLTRNVRNAQSTNCKINIHDVLQNYCYYKRKVSPKNTAVTFATVFDEQLYQKINITEDPNCVLYEQTFPEKWCIFRTIEFLKQGSPVKVFSDSPNSRISFNSSSGIFTVNKAGTYLVFGSISIISINQGIQLLGLHRDNTALVTCPSDGLGIVRADNVEKSQKKRYCNMNGVLKLELGDQLQLKTMVPNLQLLLDLPESISWLLLTEI
ncbi:uncharacterized protein LOC106051406 isoform X2 [Biomphalaria glabrata]|uniref:Uncharacterized protein LOC106051406 isoform X2 n=1 Tax=Biomphalaria glabrata TaxID=6526 RepID=A0A9W2ZLC6_BIOGL|nr:uncharacterized protein LOC106051406 isoform X2 [Biomphalaria glabrata]